MNTPVPMLQDANELHKLLARLSENQPRKILEIGSLYGGTLYTWMTNFPGALVVSVDKLAVGVSIHPTEKLLACRAEWQGWAQKNDCTLLAIEGDSSDAAVVGAAKELAPYDFIFIDGGHKYNEVNADFENYWPLLKKGGLMALHDCAVGDNDPSIDCGRWWKEIAAEWPERTELINTNPGQFGIGVIRK